MKINRHRYLKIGKKARTGRSPFKQEALRKMRKVAAVLLWAHFATGHPSCQSRPPNLNPEHEGIIRGTINVVLADGAGIVVLTDSMVTETSRDARGVVTSSRQLSEPKQKLFQIDDSTVCTIAGFASATTPPVPDFLNDVSAMIGRIVDQLQRHKQSPDTPPLKIADKLELLEAVFGYYIEGVANIRAVGPPFSEGDYYFESLIAGYDPDGTPKIGRLKLKMAPKPGAMGEFLSPVELERTVTTVRLYNEPLLAGITDVAEKIRDNPAEWQGDQAVKDYEQAKKSGKPPSIEQMRAYAISLKQHTADKYPEVGGQNQIAILSEGRIQKLEQPPFSAMSPTRFKFRIVTGVTVTGDLKDRSKAFGFWGVVTPGCFPLYFNNMFTRTRQEIGDAYYSGNVFKEAVLSYKGGRIQFGKSNQVIDSDLLLGPNIRQDSPEVQQLLRDFQGSWHSVQSEGNPPQPSYGGGMVIECGSFFDHLGGRSAN